MERVGSKEKGVPSCITPRGSLYPVHPSTSEGKEGKSGVAPGVISPLESRSKKQRRLVKDIRRKLGTLVGGVGVPGRTVCHHAHHLLLVTVLGGGL